MKHLSDSFPSTEEIVADTSLIGIPFDPEQAALVTEFASILLLRAATVNLVGPSEGSRIWSRHCLESICYGLLLDRGKPVVDIGTGAGFPGILLAIWGMRVIMLEPRRKRHLFLSHAVGRLDLQNVTVIPERLENTDVGVLGNQFTARSVASPDVILNMLRNKNINAKLVCRQPERYTSEHGTESVKLPCPPLDRPGFLVQYQTCSDFNDR